MELARRTGAMALAVVITIVLAMTFSSILGADKAYATVAKPKVTVVAKSNGQVKVSVKKVNKAKKYQYKITKDKKLKKKAYTKKTAKRSVTVKTLKPGKTYYVVVRACDSKGKWGKWSKVKKVTVKASKKAPSRTTTAIDSDQGGNQDSNQNDNQTIGVHTHDYQPGGNYDFYEQERAKNASEALRYANLMRQYNTTHSSQNGTFDASTYLSYQSMNKFYAEQASEYIALRDAEYYCSICGEKKPAESALAAGSISE